MDTIYNNIFLNCLNKALEWNFNHDMEIKIKCLPNVYEDSVGII